MCRRLIATATAAIIVVLPTPSLLTCVTTIVL
jgi:hypothetical protein